MPMLKEYISFPDTHIKIKFNINKKSLFMKLNASENEC